MGKINYFLDIQFVQSNSKIEMDQSHYLQNILQKSDMFDCKVCQSPSVSDSSQSNNPCVYREIVGDLIYAMACTRPDLSWVVC